MSGVRCGTYDGLNDHKRAGENTCSDCREAGMLYQRSWRRRRELGFPVRNRDEPRWLSNLADFPALAPVIRAGLVMSA